MNGTITDFGYAPYQFEKQCTSESFYIELDTPKGKKTMWSLGLKDALDTSGLGHGDFVSVKHTGKESVEVPVKVKENGRYITRYVTKYRSTFSITKSRKLTVKKKSTSKYNAGTVRPLHTNEGRSRDTQSSIDALKHVALGMGIGAVGLSVVTLIVI